MTPNITPCLWFNDEAEEAIAFYTSLLPGSHTGRIARYTKATESINGRPAGSVMTVEFSICGRQFTALNGGPFFKFTPAISLFVEVSSPEAAAPVFEKLAQGGDILMPLQEYPFSECFGWVQDRYGLSWQINSTGVDKPLLAPAIMFLGEHCGQAEEAMLFYANLIPGSAITNIVRYGADEAPNTEGTVKIAAFRLAGSEFRAMDNAFDHPFALSEAISFQIHCPDQKSIDTYWDALSKGGPKEAQQCGWLKDRFGISWQIVPTILPELVQNPTTAEPTMKALLNMKKLDIDELRKASQSIA